jgi:hypothetical protein
MIRRIFTDRLRADQPAATEFSVDGDGLSGRECSRRKRATTTTAMQKLFQMNSEFVTARAKRLADRFDGGDRVRQIYKEVFNREPERDELKLAKSF